MHLFSACYNDSHLKSITNIQEIGSCRRENNFMCQEHPSFCFTVIQVSLSILAFYAYCHWAVPTLVCDWAFPESGWIFAYWEPSLIPLNKIYSRRTFLNKIKWAKKKKKEASLLIYVLVFEVVQSHESSWASFYFVMSVWNILYSLSLSLFFYNGRNKCAFLSFCTFASFILSFCCCCIW